MKRLHTSAVSLVSIAAGAGAMLAFFLIFLIAGPIIWARGTLKKDWHPHRLGPNLATLTAIAIVFVLWYIQVFAIAALGALQLGRALRISN